MALIWAEIAWAAAAAFLTFVAATPAGRRQIGAAAALLAGWAFKGLIIVAPTVAVAFAQTLLDTFESNRDLWAQVVQIFVQEFTGQKLDLATLTKQIAAGPLTASSVEAGAPIIKSLIDVFIPPGPLTTEDGMRGLTRILGLTTALSLQGWYTQVAGDLVSMRFFPAASDLPERIEGGFGLNRIGRLTWRAPIKKAIEEPLTVALNRQFQYTRLSVGEATRALHRGIIDEGAFLDAAADAGYSDARGRVLLALAIQPIAFTEINELTRYGLIDADTAAALYQQAGYAPDQAKLLLQLTTGAEQQKLLNELASTARTLFKKGDLSEDEYRQFLAEANWSDVEIRLALAADQLALREQRALSTAELGQLLERAAITPDDYRARLRTQHYSDEDIDLLLALQVRRLSPAQILEAVARGRLTTDAAVRELAGFGYSQAQAEVLVDLRGKRLSEGQVLDALRQRLIQEDTARADLVGLGFSADQVDLLLAFQKRVLSPAEIQAALVRGIVTEPDALRRLRELGYSETDAQAIISLRVRLLSAGQILDAFGDAVLNRSQALADLRARGLAEGEAQQVLQVFDIRHAEAVKRAEQKAAAGQAKAIAAEEKSGIVPPSA